MTTFSYLSGIKSDLDPKERSPLYDYTNTSYGIGLKQKLNEKSFIMKKRSVKSLFGIISFTISMYSYKELIEQKFNELMDCPQGPNPITT